MVDEVEGATAENSGRYGETVRFGSVPRESAKETELEDWYRLEVNVDAGLILIGLSVRFVKVAAQEVVAYRFQYLRDIVVRILEDGSDQEFGKIYREINSKTMIAGFPITQSDRVLAFATLTLGGFLAARPGSPEIRGKHALVGSAVLGIEESIEEVIVYRLGEVVI